MSDLFMIEPLSSGRWRSWLSHLSNTQKVLSSSLGRLILLLGTSFPLILVYTGFKYYKILFLFQNKRAFTGSIS